MGKISLNKNIENNSKLNLLEFITDNILIFCYIKVENDIEIDKKFFERILSNINFEEFIYNKKEIRKFFDTINNNIYLYKLENNIENIDLSILFFISDYNSFLTYYIGKINLLLLREDEVELDLKSNNSYLIGEKFELSYINKNFELKKNDDIFIFDSEYEEEIRKFFSFKKYINIKFENINRNSYYKKTIFENPYYILFLSMLLILIIYIFSNNAYIKNIFKIDNELKLKLDNDFKINEYNEYKKVIRKKITELEKLNFFPIYLNRKNRNIREEIIKYNLIKKKELDIIENLIIREDKLKNEILKRNFENSIIEYKKMLSIIESFQNNYGNIKNDYIKKIIELEKLLSLNVDYGDNIYENFKNLKNNINIYKNSFLKVDISDLEIKLEEFNNHINKITDEIDGKIIEADLKRSTNILEARNEYIKIIEILNNIDDSIDKLDEINEKLKLLNKEIEYNESEIKRNMEEAKKEEENKNYKLALDFLKQAEKYLNKMNDFPKLKEINSKIRIINKKIKYDDENNNFNEKVKIESEMRKSLKLNIKKGDDYLKKLEYKDALKEYKNAIEIINNLNMKGDVLEKTLKKIKYIEDKRSKKWWELWK